MYYIPFDCYVPIRIEWIVCFCRLPRKFYETWYFYFQIGDSYQTSNMIANKRNVAQINKLFFINLTKNNTCGSKSTHEIKATLQLWLFCSSIGILPTSGCFGSHNGINCCTERIRTHWHDGRGHMPLPPNNSNNNY